MSDDPLEQQLRDTMAAGYRLVTSEDIRRIGERHRLMMEKKHAEKARHGETEYERPEEIET